MPVLSDYLTDTQRLLHDPQAKYYSTTDLTSYINTARGQIASEGQCVRALPTGNNAAVGQEVYPFGPVNTLVQAQFPGVQSIQGVLSVAVSWGSMKPVLTQMVWSDFQALLRSYNIGLQNYPSVYAQYGQGTSGSIYLFPQPSQVSAMDWDCYCLPIALVDDTSVEALPYPWTDAVPYYAAYKAYLNSQRWPDSKAMFDEFTKFMKRARSQSEPPFIPDYYSRWS